MDILLKRKIDKPVPITHRTLFLNNAHLIRRHALQKIRLHILVLEMEEMPRIIPDKSVLHHRLAETANLGVRLQNQVVIRAHKVCERQAAYAGAYNQVLRLVHVSRVSGWQGLHSPAV